MNWLVQSSLVATALILAVGCGGTGGRSGPTGKICGKNHNPLPIELKAGQKVELDPTAGEIMGFPGKYFYNGAEVVYKNKTTGVIIHLVERRAHAEKDVSKPGISCVYGIQPSTPDIRKVVTGLSDMMVQPNGRVTFAVRDYTIGFVEKGILRQAESGDPGRFDSPSKVYDGQTSEHAFYKNSATDDRNFQARSIIELGPTETISLVIRYRRVDCGYQGKPDCPETLASPAPNANR